MLGETEKPFSKSSLGKSDRPPVSNDDQVKAYIKKIMKQLNQWMVGGKISKLVVVITSKETGEHVERWQFDVQIFNKSSKSSSQKGSTDKENTAPAYVQLRTANLSRLLTLSVETTPFRQPQPISPRVRYRKRSKRFFDRLQHLSPFCQCLMATVPSTF